MVFGYCLLILGQMLVASALGEYDHPTWPEWNSSAISEGLIRWLWAALFGLTLGGFPMIVYWLYCGNIDGFDRIVFAELAVLGTGYAQMMLAAALLNDSLVAANPVTVLASIFRIGWDYVVPCLVSGVAHPHLVEPALGDLLSDHLTEARVPGSLGILGAELL